MNNDDRPPPTRPPLPLTRTMIGLALIVILAGCTTTFIIVWVLFGGI